MSPFLVFFLSLLVVAPCIAGDINQVDTYLAGARADAYIGEEFRADVAKSIVAAQRGDDRAAWSALSSALTFCGEQRSSDGTRVYSVSNDAEAKEYLASAEAGVRTTFVDHACPAAYKAAAFLAVRASDSQAAFAYLDRAQELAPHWAEPVAERAYLVGKLGDRAASLEIYQAALGLTERYPSSAYVRPLVLRGIGFALIELDRLDEAQRAFETSLALEPTSELAKKEMIYIQQHLTNLRTNPSQPQGQPASAASAAASGPENISV